MIKSWKNSASRQFSETGKSRFSGLDANKAHIRINALDRAKTLQALTTLSSVGLHKLGRERKGQWAMTINGPWRLVFEFKDGDAYNLEIVDYH
jgi:proteic killer suppression protein